MDYDTLFSDSQLTRLFPGSRTDRFFEALLGDAEDGAYHIALVFEGARPGKLHFAFALTPRNGKCLACHLTYGLPEVFARHPVINVSQLVASIEALLPENTLIQRWELGHTREINDSLHHIPLQLFLGEH